MPRKDDNPELRSREPAGGRDDRNLRPLSNRSVAMFFAMLVAALVLGYLFLNKLVDMSSEEDCMLAHRRDCGTDSGR